MDICNSLHKWGIKKIVFVSPHGGNSSVIQDVSYRLRYEKGILSARVSYFLAGVVDPKLSGYGSEGLVDETSMMLYLRPDTAHPEKAKFKEYDNPFGSNIKVLGHSSLDFGKGAINVYTTSKDIAKDCEWAHTEKAIDMSNASRELGEKIIETAVDYIVEFIEEFRKIQIPPTY
jgi:creatinine amidohydrolase